MRVMLIHGGLWHGWWLYERDDGGRRLMKDLTHEEVEGLAAHRMEDVTPPTALRRTQRDSHRRRRPRHPAERPDWLEVV